ncbi:hypothetical protein RZS08_55395, partial [Arthrospira platensis SPKY1]|nr:hypothetical protein [Arthrospira platensis SPKY1]
MHGLRRPGLDRTPMHGLRGIGDDQLGIDQKPLAEPVARRAGAVGIIEGEEPGLDFGQGEARDGAGELGRQGQALGRVG